MNDEVRIELEARARAQETVYYSELRDDFDPDLSMLAFYREYVPILDYINRAEHAQGRPLLSAVVVNKALDIPGAGFFTQARALALYAGSDDEEFWQAEIKRVYDFWARRTAH